MSVEIRNEAEIKALDKKPEKTAKKNRLSIAPFLILLIILAAIVSILTFNLFNLRDRYIYPFLSRLPLIGGFIPITADMPEDFSTMTTDEMIARINDLEEQLFYANQEIKEADKTIERNKSEIDRLKIFEAQQLQFKQDKADFDEQVAMANPQAYASYYESISPENAEFLYPRAVAELSRMSELRKYMSDIAQMDEVSAAAVLQQMIGTDMDLVVSIMRHMESRNAGAILSEMNPGSAASIIKMMAPFNATPHIYQTTASVVTPAGTPVISPAAAPEQIVNELTELP